LLAELYDAARRNSDYYLYQDLNAEKPSLLGLEMAFTRKIEA